jgi:alpha-ketoglutarate-dependent 2,4-dichlorophenoxyacetate dioxygenase
MDNLAITIRKLTPVFGAEITGVDLTRLDDATFEHIEDAFETYSVLVFPNQNLDDDAQIAFSRRFGELEKTQGHIANNFQVKHVSEITNLDPDGKLMGPDDPRVLYRLGQRNWHSDSSFKRVPAKASLLHARKLPPDGGDTQFASLRAAYDALPDARKRELEDKVAIHHYAYSRRNGGYALTNEAEDKRFPPVPQAMIRANPVNGRKALYVGSHASHIRGMPEEEGRALLKELLDFATQDQFTYLHHWKVGDLVMYDNRAAVHRATVMGEGPTVVE